MVAIAFPISTYIIRGETMSKSILNIRFPNDLKMELKEIAQIQGRSLSNLIIFILRKFVEEWEQKEW